MRTVTSFATLLLALGCAGESAVTPLALPVVPGAEQADPALAVDPASGDLLAAWASGDSAAHALYFARSRDGGTTWTTPSRLFAPAADYQPHAESSPRLVAASGVIAVAWVNSVPVAGRRWPASNVRLARSTDGGATWSAALTLNDDSARTAGGHIFHGAAWEGDSGLVVAWLDERQGGPAATRPAAPVEMGHEHGGGDREPDATVYLARSADLGASWARTNAPAWSAACPCCRVTLARGPAGRVVAAWRRHFAGDVRDVVVAPLGAAEPALVHEDGWVYPGCPHTGPGLAVGADGTVHTAWFLGKQGSAGIYYAKRGADGAFRPPVPIVTAASLPTAHATVAALADGGALVAYDIAADGRRVPSLAALAPSGALARTITLARTGTADHPQVVVLPDGHAVVAWTDLAATGRVIRLVHVEAGR